MKNIGIVGAGKWGQALYFALSKKNSVSITSKTQRAIKNFIPSQELLDSCKQLIIAIPAQQTRQWLDQNFIYNNQQILVATKGIEATTGALLTDIYKQYLPLESVGFLSGPSFASEVIQSLPTALVINSTNEEVYKTFAPLFPNFIKTYYSDDIIGAEIAGAYKNVLAIASGICEGLHLGNNAKASLISRGLVEMERFSQYFGKTSTQTFYGLSGAGDLFLTANSVMSRNYRVGLGLATNKPINVILEELGEVAEGIKTSEAIKNLAKQHNIYAPIANEVQLIIEGKNPKDSLQDLLQS